MKGGLKALGIVGAIFALMLFFAWINTSDETLDNSLENIDDTKFPISDYLYFEQPLEPSNPAQDIYRYNNVANQPNPNLVANNNATNEANNPNANANPFASEDEKKENENADAEDNKDKKDDKDGDSKDSKDEKKDESNSIGDMFNKFADKAKKVSEDAFEEEVVDEETLRQRQALLATRTGDISILSKGANAPSLSIEYGVSKFTNLDEQDKASNEHKLYRTISAMKMIPAVLLTNISSDIGGKCIAQVEEDIYAEMGKAILIPKGSKVLGNYANNNKIGEFRLNVLWTRILTPQGVNIMLTDSYGADLAGAMGIIGDLDSKYWQRYGIPLALSTLSNGLILTLNNVTQKATDSASNAYINAQMMQNFQGDISGIMAAIINEQVKIKPTIRIEKGSRIFITSNKDIFFPIPKNNEVLARFFDEVKQETITQSTTEESL